MCPLFRRTNICHGQNMELMVLQLLYRSLFTDWWPFLHVSQVTRSRVTQGCCCHLRQTSGRIMQSREEETNLTLGPHPVELLTSKLYTYYIQYMYILCTYKRKFANHKTGSDGNVPEISWLPASYQGAPPVISRWRTTPINYRSTIIHKPYLSQL